MMTRLSRHPRTSEGAFWHKTIYPSQIWLDGLYMAEPFYAEYAVRYARDKEAAYKDIINDFVVAARHTYDPATGLYRHAWDETRSMFWCDPQTGQSQHCWGRALGWYCMALVEVLEILPEDAEGRESLLEILRGIVNVLPSFADPDTGMWYQVLDCPGREGNYLEATCSAMFSYTLLKGVRLGYLDASLEEYARKVYDGLVKTFISEDEDGLISINQCCSVGGLGGKAMRMGDYDYYLSEPVRSNDPKGVGPFIWASLEMERR
jgi:unsaturated rhamnogalacturonyl hydrolase